MNGSTEALAVSEALTDGAVCGLFAGFVLLLFLGYLNADPGLPFSAIAAVLLLAALGTLFGSNWRADRRARGSESPPLT